MKHGKATVIAHDQNGETYRATVNLMNIALISAKEKMVELNGTSLYEVTVALVDGGAMTIYINSSDLDLLENAIGTFITDI